MSLDGAGLGAGLVRWGGNARAPRRVDAKNGASSS